MGYGTMGKFYKAIEKTEKSRKKITASPDKRLDRSAIYNDDILRNKNKGDSSTEFAADARIQNFTNNKIDNKLIAAGDPTSFEAEQIRILKTNIFNPGSGEIPRTILVTSAVPYEGKSFIAANLAICLAQSIDRHAILIDCDLRMPSIHRLFGYERVPGLSDCLNNGHCISELLLKTTTEKLCILPGGNKGNNTSELLSSKGMAKLLCEIKERYSDRFVIIDSPPPSLASETKVIAQHVDGVILVVKLGSTRRELVAEIVESIGREKIIGIVVNWFDMRSLLSFLYGKYSKYERYYRKYRSK